MELPSLSTSMRVTSVRLYVVMIINEINTYGELQSVSNTNLKFLTPSLLLLYTSRFVLAAAAAAAWDPGVVRAFPPPLLLASWAL